MLRFYDKDVFYTEYDSLNRSELRSFFLTGNQSEIVCILKEGNYIGYITWHSLLCNDDIYESIQKEYIILDGNVWENGRKSFVRHRTAFGEAVQIPVLNTDGQLIYFAWQDEEANRELRMLRELEECKGALTFRDLNQKYEGVTIHGFNEFAYYMAKYLKGLGIAVNVEGELWNEFGSWEKNEMPAHKNYEIWAEGVWQKNGDLEHERLRSVSPEFECVDKIYEANIKAGKITDAEGGADALLQKLENKKEIIVIGTDAESQDAYDFLLSNGIDICAFLEKERAEEKRRLFGKPVLRKIEILNRFANAVFIECHSKYSAWGFGEVDHYDYEGYRRNDKYFLLRDYIEMTGYNLQHVLQEKNILFIGDADLCGRVWKWQEQYATPTGKAAYWDILEENKPEDIMQQMPVVKKEKAGEYDVIALVAVKYDSDDRVTAKAVEKYDEYIKKLNQYEIYDYTDYFSDKYKLAGLPIKEELEIRKELRPLGIVIGSIPWYSGNFLVRWSFAGHPRIMMIEDYNYLNDNLYFTCIRLAGKKAAEILPCFWLLYQREAKEGAWEKDFPDKESFVRKMEELLQYGSYFTSQELFVMFHIAYEAMYGKEIKNPGNMVIYWEAHAWKRGVLRAWSYWLGSSGLSGFVLRTVRNSYIRAGSSIRARIGKKSIWEFILSIGTAEGVEKAIYQGWEEIIIKFEDLKKTPREILANLCEQLHIGFDENLLMTTIHGSRAFYKEITGFDLKPVYNLYEEYFTSFDRMRICLLNSAFQRKYGYPFVNCLDFCRRELQEMFLKEFFWEKMPEAVAGKDTTGVWLVQERIRKKLWQLRFCEVMDTDELF